MIPAAGALLLGAVGWLLGPLWAVAGILVGAVAALSVLVIVFVRGRNRRLTIKDRSAYLPSLAEALTRQADELGHLDRITEARAAIAEAEMISTDMLPSTQS